MRGEQKVMPIRDLGGERKKKERNDTKINVTKSSAVAG